MDDHVLVIERLQVAVGGLRCERGKRAHCPGDVDPPVAVPVADPLPVAVLVDELPVDELPVVVPAVLAWPELGELAGVVEVVPPGD